MLGWELLPQIVHGVSSGRVAPLKVAALSILASIVQGTTPTTNFKSLFKMMTNALKEALQQELTANAMRGLIRELVTIINTWKVQEDTTVLHRCARLTSNQQTKYVVKVVQTVAEAIQSQQVLQTAEVVSACEEMFQLVNVTPPALPITLPAEGPAKPRKRKADTSKQAPPKKAKLTVDQPKEKKKHLKLTEKKMKKGNKKIQWHTKANNNNSKSNKKYQHKLSKQKSKKT